MALVSSRFLTVLFSTVKVYFSRRMVYICTGRTGLAKATASSTLVATILSLVTELTVGSSAAAVRSKSPSGRAVIFSICWAACQIVRVVALPRLVGEDGTENAALLWGLTFADKWTGPLGDLAAEFVALEVLRRGLMRGTQHPSRRSGVSVGFLTSSRTALVKVARPALELLLMKWGHDAALLALPVGMLVAVEVALVLNARRLETTQGPTTTLWSAQ